MSIRFHNDYFLLVKFGENVLPLNISNLNELTIIQDIDKFLPSFRIRIVDPSGSLTHIIPFDKGMSNVYIEIATDINSEKEWRNSFNFVMYRRKPEAGEATPSTLFDASGLLNVSGLFIPTYCRGLSGNINNNLASIAKNELNIDKVELSSGLNYEKTLLQPCWSNIQFLKHLIKNIAGSGGEYAYRCFVKRYKSDSIFVFNSLTEMIQNQPVFKFILSIEGYEDRLPIRSYAIYDNYKIHAIFASKKQDYSYFNYDNSEYVTGSEKVQDYDSLSDYFLIDNEDEDYSFLFSDTGRSCSFTSNFLGRIKTSYANRLQNLVNMWIVVPGLPNIVPGQIVDLFFPHGLGAESLYSYQYSGYWLVNRVVHNFGQGFITKLLLSRQGVDTDVDTTLVKAIKRKRV